MRLWSRYGGDMLFVVTTLPDADDVPGAEEEKAENIDPMDEEWDPYEVRSEACLRACMHVCLYSSQRGAARRARAGYGYSF